MYVSPSRRDGMLVENTSPTAQPPSRQGRNVGRKHKPNRATAVPSGTECENRRL
ncbi:MAG: hypothetical protein LBD59_06550 [Prevotellaceae bacterium]|nr:hypothetical protein [Prevotellaceae bacterium]